MRYDVQCDVGEGETKTTVCTVTCYDAEAKAFMKAINRELKRMKAQRKREIHKGLKEGIRSIPHTLLSKAGNKFSFDTFHFEDLCTAAESLGKQRARVRSSFLTPMFEVTLEQVTAFEKAIAKQKKD